MSEIEVRIKRSVYDAMSAKPVGGAGSTLVSTGEESAEPEVSFKCHGNNYATELLRRESAREDGEYLVWRFERAGHELRATETGVN